MDLGSCRLTRGIDTCQRIHIYIINFYTLSRDRQYAFLFHADNNCVKKYNSAIVNRTINR